jgi:hypothetical protein
MLKVSEGDTHFLQCFLKRSLVRKLNYVKGYSYLSEDISVILPCNCLQNKMSVMCFIELRKFVRY